MDFEIERGSFVDIETIYGPVDTNDLSEKLTKKRNRVASSHVLAFVKSLSEKERRGQRRRVKDIEEEEEEKGVSKYKVPSLSYHFSSDVDTDIRSTCVFERRNLSNGYGISIRLGKG